MLKTLGIIGFSALMAATVFLGIVSLASIARAQVVPAQNQIIPSAYFGDGFLISTSTSGTHKLGATLVDLAGAFITGVLGVQNGGTGSTTLTGILRGDGTNSIKTLLIGTGLSYNGTTLSSTGESVLTFVYPLVRTVNSISLAFGTTTSNTWAGTQTFTLSPIFSTLGAGTVNSTAGGTIYNTATSTATLASPFSYSGTWGQFISGVSGTLDLANNGISLGKIAQIGANTILGNPTGSTANVQAFATSSLGIALSDTTGTLTVARGGTGSTTAPAGQLLYGGGSGVYQSVATTSASCSGNASCPSFTIIGTTPVTITASGGSGNGLATSTVVGVNQVPYGTSASTVGFESGFEYDPSIDTFRAVNASTTRVTSSYASSTAGFFGSATIGTITGLLKATAGLISQAVAGTDYVAGGTGANTQVTYFTGSGAIAGDAGMTYNATNDTVTVVNASTTNITSTGGAQFATSNGNVGVGNATPSYKLDVSGFINTDQFSGYKQNGNTVLYASTTNTSLALGASGAAGWMSATSSSFNTVAIGQGALAATPTTGAATYNVGIGSSALAANTTGYRNVALGGLSLLANTTGYNNFALGFFSTRLNTTGHDNVAIGALTLFNSNSDNNVAIGSQALTALTSGTDNTSIGMNSMLLNITGGSNVGIGSGALINNASATNTTAIGTGAGLGTASYSNQGGTYVGYLSGRGSATGSDYNTFLGYQAGYGITTGSNNIVLGSATSSANIQNLTTGTQNILIGNNNALPSSTANGQLNIGNFIYGTGITGVGTTLSPGAIGIGTTTPGRALSVQGSSNFSGDLFAAGITATGTLRLSALSDGCLNVTSGAVGSAACGGGSSFGQAWEVDGSGFLAPTTTIDVFIPDDLRFDAANTYVKYNNPGFVFNTPDYFAFGTASAVGLTIDTTDGVFTNNNNGYRQREAGSTIRTILNIDASDILTVGNSVLPTVIEGNAVTIPDVTSGTMYADGTGLLSAQTGTSGVCVEWGANGSLVDAASAGPCGAGGGGTPGGSGSELQYRTGASTFGGIPNSAVDALGNVGIGSTTPWALFAVASSTWGGVAADFNRPLFAVATSSDSFGSLFSVFATSSSAVSSSTNTLNNPGVRFLLGGLTTYLNRARDLYDQFRLVGRMSSTWTNEYCDSPILPAVAITADVNNLCGFMMWDEVTTGTIAGVGAIINDGLTRGYQITVSSAATLDGSTIFTGPAILSTQLSTSTPILEIKVGSLTPVSTTTSAHAGWFSSQTSRTASGCGITATSTANWIALCRNVSGVAVQQVDTGIATGTVQAKFRLELTQNSFVVRAKTDYTTQITTVAQITSGIPNDSGLTLFPQISVFRQTSGTPVAPSLRIFGVRSWYQQPWEWAD